MGAGLSNALNPEEVRTYRLNQEAAWYRSEDGFLDFVRDSGAAPDAEFQPHGRYCQELIHWNGEPDPGNPAITIYKHKLTLWPRGSFKSHVFTIGRVCWEIARDPNLRILVCSETGKQAIKFVDAAMKIIDSEWFKELFGVHRGKDWRRGSFHSALRTRKGTKDPTLQASGVGEVQTGAHWDLILFDDVCSQENTKTPDAIESLWNWAGEMMAQLDPGCRLAVTGTLHHYSDIYCRILGDPKLRQLFEVSVHSWANPIVDPEGTEPTELFFPSRLTRSFVSHQKRFMTERLYACFYENRPMTDERQLFRPSYFRVIDDHEVPAHVWTYIFTDFAFIAEEKKKGVADRTVFWVVALDCNRTAYVLDFYCGRWKPSDSVRIACDLWNRYSQKLETKGISIEDTAHKEVLSSLFDEIKRQVFVNPRIIPIPGRSQEVKDLRIEAAEPRFRRGDIYFTKSLRNQPRKWKPMFKEMTEWPFSKHDDIPDAISDIDKQDKDGKMVFPGPPIGWRASTATRFVPKMLDGAFNPDAAYPAREMARNDQVRVGDDLWRRGMDRGASLNDPFTPGAQTNVPSRRWPS